MTFQIPFLVQPVDVVVEQLDADATVYDENAREAIGQVARSDAITLSAQISYGKTDGPAWKFGGQGGVSSDSTGRVAFLKRTLDAAGVTLARGDRITSVAGNVQNLYLTEEKLTGHMSGATNLIVWRFEDKRPGKL